MTYSRSFAVAALLAAADQAAAQPVLDGRLAGDQSFYGPIQFVQTVPTQFGDNHPDNVPPSGNPQDVTTGVEFAIPLAAIGGPSGAGDIRLAGWVNSGDRSFMSNQVVGGLPGLGNLGTTSNIDFNTISGTQWITVTAPDGAAPVVDGMRDALYGPPVFLQNNFTQFGDATHGNIDGGGGSEIDAVYARVSGGTLYLFIAGNLEANGNGLDLFFDTVGGGQGTLLNTNPVVPANNGLNTMAGLDFDTDFTADYYLTISGNDPGGGFVTQAHYADLNASTGFFLGNGGYGTDGTLAGGDVGAPAVSATINNSNTIGVIGEPGVSVPNDDYAVGSEIDGVFAHLDETTDRLYVLVTGNLQSNFNQLVLFVDAAPGGQNTLRGDNVNISFNGLNAMGTDLNDPFTFPGLTFDAEFEADYYTSFKTGGAPVEQFLDSAVLRTNGPITDFNGFVLDYGAYSGGVKSLYNPVPYNGTFDPCCWAAPSGIQFQAGVGNIYTNWAPRNSTAALQAALAAGVDSQAEFDSFVMGLLVPGLLRATINNSNIAGVTSDSAAGAAAVTTGVEYSFDLEEIGWDRTQDIRIAGFVASGDFSFMSNQVIGGLPEGTGNLGTTRQVNFAAIKGQQYVTLSFDETCIADFDDSGTVDSNDYFAFLTAFFNGDPSADVDGTPGINSNDYFFFLTAFFEGCA